MQHPHVPGRELRLGLHDPGMAVYTCIEALGNDCSDGTPQCQCWNGPLP